ncbi:MAG: acetate kinase, partial [Terriglobales bacterium]
HFLDEKLDDVLNKKSGLLGISGISGDMRKVLAAVRNGDEPAKARAQLAFDMYVHRLRSGIGAMIAVLGGIDVLVFTAGVGENSEEVRAAACENLGFAGVQLDRAKNAQSPTKGDTDVSNADAAVRVLVIHAQEDWMIARKCWSLLRKQSATA